MTYQHVSGNQYKFTLILFRDCAGTDVFSKYQIDYGSLSCNYQNSFNVFKVSQEEISPVCPSEASTCRGGTAPGIQKYVYEGTVSIETPCSDWVFSWNTPGEKRNAAITNIVDPEITSIYIEAKLNNLSFTSNNSPVFDNLPVSYLGLGQSNSINPGASDVDGDQLVFKTTTPRTKVNGTVEYIPPFSATNPLSSNPPFSINSQDGSILINPTKEETSVTAILVEEYRNGTLVGSVMRDIQLITQDLSNTNPVIGGINGETSKSIDACAGSTLCFKIPATDPDGQVVQLSAAGPGIFNPGAPSINAEGEFCWNIPLNTAPRTYYLYVTAIDNNCPIFGQSTETFEINVNAPPIVSLSREIPVPCNELVEITPDITGGTEPFTYLWSSGNTSPTITRGSGFYLLNVTDANGCSSLSDTVFLINSVVTEFTHTEVCGEESVDFTDGSSSTNGPIVDWQWDFGDPDSPNNSSSTQNPKHVFSRPGVYEVTLNIRDSEGCLGTAIDTVKVCDVPVVDFSKLDSCKHKALYFQDASSVEICGIENYILTVDGATKAAYGFGPDYDTEYYYPGNPDFFRSVWIPEDTGWHEVTVTLVNEYGCENSLSKDVYIYDNPYIDIIEGDSYFECDNPIKVLNATDTAGGRSPLEVFWSDGSYDTLSITVDSPGTYWVRIEDSLGCDTVVYRDIVPPLIADARSTIYCSEGDSIKFTDLSQSYWDITNWTWEMGNGTVFNYTDPALGKEFLFKYPEDGTYEVILTVVDESNCLDSDTLRVNQTLPDTSYSISPLKICSYDTLTLLSPRGEYIKSIEWDMGNGVHKYIAGDTTAPVYIPLRVDQEGNKFFDHQFKYPNGSAGDDYVVSLIYYYNKFYLEESQDTIYCRKEEKDTVTIFEEFKVNPKFNGTCEGDTTFLVSELISGSPIATLNWEINRIDHVHEENQVHYDVVGNFPKDTALLLQGDSTYIFLYTATNTDGCKFETVRQEKVIEMPEPYICPENLCVNRQTLFFYSCQVFPEGKVDSVFWDFGDPYASEENKSSTGHEPFHIYSKDSIYNVTVQIFNTDRNCMEDTTMPVRIFPLPEPDFTSTDPICEGQEVQFFDQSQTAVPGSNIEFITWVFNETDTSYAKNPTKLYTESGTYKVKLFATDSISGCADTATREVIVNPSPQAGFYFSENELVTERPIKFYDESTGGFKWVWVWGDGDSLEIIDPLNKNPEHTYSAVFPEVEIKQIVINEFGCTDTAIKTLDLKVYLLIPNAFSPNGDGNNDGLYLFYKGIEELLEFRVYNRWGELVFDGGNDLDAIWDGTYKGEEQPLGSYVYYIKAKDYHQEVITHSGKVALIR